MTIEENSVDKNIITEIGTKGIVYSNRFISVKQDKVRFPDGFEDEYSVVNNGTGFGAIVIPITVHNGRKYFGLVSQYRYTVQQFTLEFPGGGSDDFSEEGAITEIVEELGQEALRLKLIGVVFPESSLLKTEAGIWVAYMDASILDTNHTEDITGIKTEWMSEEDITGIKTEWMSEEEIIESIRSKQILSGVTLAAYALYKAIEN